jgi:hypothetical protein
MAGTDVLIGKVVSYSILVIGAILFLVASSKLYFYDAEDNGLKTLKEGEFQVEDGNEGYRIYTQHNNCGEVEIELYYESFMNMGNLIFNPTCKGNLFEFGSATSGDWYYIGTLTFEGKSYSTPSEEVKVDFNVTSSHEVMISDREPIVDGLNLRTISMYSMGLGALIFGVTRKSELESTINQESSNGIFHTHISSSNNQAALAALASLKNYILTTNTTHTKLFSSFDLNADGTINHFELVTGLNSVGIGALSGYEDVNALVSLLDLNGDGKIDLRELGIELDKKL